MKQKVNIKQNNMIILVSMLVLISIFWYYSISQVDESMIKVGTVVIGDIEYLQFTVIAHSTADVTTILKLSNLSGYSVFVDSFSEAMPETVSSGETTEFKSSLISINDLNLGNPSIFLTVRQESTGGGYVQEAKLNKTLYVYSCAKGKCITEKKIGVCSSCDECNEMLYNSDYSIVKLSNDIINYSKPCIIADYFNPINNKIFDCQGHIIDGNDVGTGWSNYVGINIDNSNGNTIQNCVITDFYMGIYINFWASKNTIINNTITSNEFGVYLQNHAHDNILISNTVCANKRYIWDYDIQDVSGEHNSGDNNTCKLSIQWNDTRTTGCTYSCT